MGWAAHTPYSAPGTLDLQSFTSSGNTKDGLGSEHRFFLRSFQINTTKIIKFEDGWFSSDAKKQDLLQATRLLIIRGNFCTPGNLFYRLVDCNTLCSPERSQRETQLRYDLSFQESKRLNNKCVIRHFKVQVLTYCQTGSIKHCNILKKYSAILHSKMYNKIYISPLRTIEVVFCQWESVRHAGFQQTTIRVN